MSDTGNPSTFKIFMGKYPTTANRFVMLTILNDVQFMDDYTADATGKLTTLPAQCRPTKAMKILAPIQRAKNRAAQQIEVVTNVTTAGTSVVTDGIAQANGLQLTEGEFTALTKATSKSATVVNALTMGTVKGVDEVQKTTITVGTDEHSLPYGAITINPDGTVMGEANSTYYMNGISFNISGNFYH